MADLERRDAERFGAGQQVCVVGVQLVEKGRRNESLYVAPLLDAVRARGFNAETAAMDRGYDNHRVYADCHEPR